MISSTPGMLYSSNVNTLFTLADYVILRHTTKTDHEKIKIDHDMRIDDETQIWYIDWRGISVTRIA